MTKLNLATFGNKNAAILALTVMGLLQIIGHVSKSEKLETFARLTGISPLPLVFDSPDGYEYWNSKFEFSFLAHDKTPITIQATSEIFQKLPGPHLLKLSYLIPLAFLPRLPETFWKPVLLYGFCTPGQLVPAFGLADKIQTFAVRITQGKNVWTKTLTCP